MYQALPAHCIRSGCMKANNRCLCCTFAVLKPLYFDDWGSLEIYVQRLYYDHRIEFDQMEKYLKFKGGEWLVTDAQ